MSFNNNDCNADELETPTWLNNDFLTEVLVQHVKEPNLKITAITMSPASAKGDHYASVMFRAGVEYTTQKGAFSKSLIIKTMPEQDGLKKDLLGDAKIFPTEIAMYTKVLPKFEAMLHDAGDKTKLYARCVYHSLEPRQVMIFEDLVSEGFFVVRNRSATLEELKAALKKLAKWHAVSYKLLKEQPELFEDLQYDLTALPNFLEQDFLTKALPIFIDMLGEVETLKKYQKYFEPFRNNLIKSWVDIIREYRENRQDNGNYILCHGDFHLRNMMYRDNECMLLDFQMSYVGSMANDVIYAIYMLFGPDERRHNCDELIYHYFENFANTIANIGYEGKISSLLEFRKQLFDKRNTDILLLTTFLPGMTSMRKGVDPSEFIQDDKRRLQLYYDPDYQQQLEYLLPRMLHLGYFEQA